MWILNFNLLVYVWRCFDCTSIVETNCKKFTVLSTILTLPTLQPNLFIRVGTHLLEGGAVCNLKL